MIHESELPVKSLGTSTDTLRNPIFDEAESMPLKWTFNMTGSIYPVGVIPENKVY
jgi:hypothetical protein